MKKIKILSLLLIGACLLPTTLFAKEISVLYRGIRPLGMGDAFTAVADDENAAFYNPAGLTKVEKWKVDLINPQVEFSTKGIELGQDIMNLKDLESDITPLTDLMSKLIGEHYHLRTSLLPNFTKKNWEFALLTQLTVDLEPHNRQSPEVAGKAVLDAGGVIAYGHGFLEDALSVGITGKAIYRMGIDKTYKAIDVALSKVDFAEDAKKIQKGNLGAGMDLGAIYTFQDIPMEPSIGVAVENVIAPDFKEGGKLKRKVNTGIALRTPSSWFFKTILAADYRDITKNVDEGEDKDMAKRLHLGLEIGIPVIKLRTGLNQGYPSFGASINLKDLSRWLFLFPRIDAAMYTEEQGAFAGQRPDERYVILLSWGF